MSNEHNEIKEEAVDLEQEQETVQEEQAQAEPRLEELEKLAEENQQRYLRAQADFDNFRRRTMKEKEELAQYASMKLIGQLLPVVDNFERAVAAASAAGDYDSLVKGVDMIFRQLDQTLQQEGLKVMETVGEPFNPEYHQAIMTVESEEHAEGIIVEEVQKGYILKEKVLRPAMVKVSG
ncbi:nucleotide exchange factor GrpE [Paenibacillus sp. NPDC058071]|uniref:nucleotide exchange factor GrpE n=1 Tax=Paenibacillus sp. NPDC058071 TaxID=3346326 RepID=UPI0036DAF811